MQPAKGYVHLFSLWLFRPSWSYPELVSAYLDASTDAVALVWHVQNQSFTPLFLSGEFAAA